MTVNPRHRARHYLTTNAVEAIQDRHVVTTVQTTNWKW